MPKRLCVNVYICLMYICTNVHMYTYVYNVYYTYEHLKDLLFVQCFNEQDCDIIYVK